MLDSFEIKEILEGFRKRLEVFPDFHRDKKLVEKAVDFALEAHKNQFRKYSGRVFIHHPLKVGLRTYEQYQDIPLLIAGILHDTIEDGPQVTQADVYREFGDEIGFLVDAVSDNYLYFYRHEGQVFEDKIEKLLYGGMKDVRCLLLKIFDRNHNLKGLNEKKPKDQIKKCFETQAIYHPIKIVIGYTDKSKNWRENSKIFNQFLKDNKSKSAKELKEFLYEIAFANISKDLFELTKNDPQNIIRKIQDKKLFEELLQIPNLDEKVKILNMECDRNGEFMVTFQYLKLEIIETNGKNLFLHGFNV